MRLINESQAVDINEKVTVETTVGELALIYSIIGGVNRQEVDKSITDEGNNVIHEIQNELLAKSTGLLYEDIGEILFKKGAVI